MIRCRMEYAAVVWSLYRIKILEVEKNSEDSYKVSTRTESLNLQRKIVGNGIANIAKRRDLKTTYKIIKRK